MIHYYIHYLEQYAYVYIYIYIYIHTHDIRDQREITTTIPPILPLPFQDVRSQGADPEVVSGHLIWAGADDHG